MMFDNKTLGIIFGLQHYPYSCLMINNLTFGIELYVVSTIKTTISEYMLYL